MAFTEGRSVGQTNDTNDVTLVAAPAASTRRVIKYITVYNNDTVAADVTVKYDANGTDYILAHNATLASGALLEITYPVTLANTTDTIQIILGGGVTTNQLTFFATWADIT